MERFALLMLPLAIGGCLEIGDSEAPSGSGGDASSVGGGNWVGGGSGGSGALGGTGGTSGGTGGTGGAGGSGGASCGIEFTACTSTDDCCGGKACLGFACCTISQPSVSCKTAAECCTGDACQEVQGGGASCCATRGKSCAEAVCCGSDECSDARQLCCAPLQSTCNADQECCTGLSCESGQCCKSSGTVCGNSGECCGLALCLNGTCQ